MTLGEAFHILDTVEYKPEIIAKIVSKQIKGWKEQRDYVEAMELAQDFINSYPDLGQELRPVKKECPHCRGTGFNWTYNKICHRCGTKGYKTYLKRVKKG